jgi:hypothetical protein
MIPDSVVEAWKAAWFNNGGPPVPVHAMIAALEAAAPMLAPQWIPCGERMPKKGERVLVWMACRKRASLTIATWTGEVWFHHVGDYHESDVSHWMPLPQPPKESGV